MKLLVQKLDPDAKIPLYAHEGDAGMDLFALEEAILAPGQIALLRTGLKLAIPKGYAGFVWDKSGLALKHRLTTLAGVIDSSYRGEVQVVLMNLGNNEYHVEKGSKIAQLIISPVSAPDIEESVISDETDRGTGGFGSTGTK